MTERHHRNKSRDRHLPSRHMRSLLRQALFGVHRLQRGFAHARRLAAGEAAETLAVLQLCRRAVARDGVPDWLAGLRTPPATLELAMAALELARELLLALDIAWDQRLIAAGIDPKWPDSGA